MNLNKIDLKVSIAFLFLLNTQIHAQHDYIPMAVENAQTLIYKADYDYMPPFEDYYYGYKITGDIEIDGVWYKEVYYRRFTPVTNDGGPAEPPLYLSSEYLVGAIRDDIPNKKVYGQIFQHTQSFGDCELNQEILLYDFNMNLGDFFNDFCLVVTNEYTEIDSVNSIDIFGEIRIVYNLYNTDFMMDWGYIMEGIGGDGGLFASIYGHPEDGAVSFIRYCIGNDEECLSDYLIDVNEYNIHKEIGVFPNPVVDIINITSSPSLRMQSIEIYNIYGKLILSKKENLKKIDISNLKDGLYLLKLHTNKGIIAKKIIKKTSM